MEERTRMCFNTVDLSKDELKKILRLLRNAKTKQQGEDLLLNKYMELKDVKCVQDAISEAIRVALDESFKSHIANTAAVDYFGNGQSDEWARVFQPYGQTVCSKMQAIVDEIITRGAIDTMDPDVSTVLKTCPLKAKLIFANTSARDDFASFPFMSASIFSSLKAHLERIEGAILEVCDTHHLRKSLYASICANTTSLSLRKSSYASFCANDHMDLFAQIVTCLVLLMICAVLIIKTCH